MENKKVLVLNSGGFDSVCLAHYVKRELEKEPVFLFFEYDQRNISQEFACAERVSEKLGGELITVDLPPFSWSNSNMLSEDSSNDNQYIEMRNLIFLSYAVSLAEKAGIEEIYLALIKNEGVEPYKDCTVEFIEGFNKTIEATGIKVIAPFIDMVKIQLATYVVDYDITEKDFFSCNVPKILDTSIFTPDDPWSYETIPCGECSDCRQTIDIYDHLNTKTLESLWIKSGFSASEEFDSLFMKKPVTEVRVLNNDICQLKCKHCFYGFDKMSGEQLSLEEYQKFIDLAVKNGISNFHFAGKEPLVNDQIFDILRYIHVNYPDVTYDIVTNGINAVKYYDQITELEVNNIFVSVDSLLHTTIRSSSDPLISTLEKYKGSEKPKVNVHMTLHKNNYREAEDIILELREKYLVDRFYLTPVMPIGNGQGVQDIILSVSEVNEVLEDILDIPVMKDLEIKFSVRAPYVYADLAREEDSVMKYLLNISVCAGVKKCKNVVFLYEMFCNSFTDIVTLTPDGYVLGCATEMSSKNYCGISAGNIRDVDLLGLIETGKTSALKRLHEYVPADDCGCHHTPYKINL